MIWGSVSWSGERWARLISWNIRGVRQVGRGIYKCIRICIRQGLKSTSNITFHFNRLLLITLIRAQLDSLHSKEHHHPLDLYVLITVHTAVCLWMNLPSRSKSAHHPLTEVVFPPSQCLRHDLCEYPLLYDLVRNQYLQNLLAVGCLSLPALTLIPFHVCSLFFHQLYSYKRFWTRVSKRDILELAVVLVYLTPGFSLCKIGFDVNYILVA